MIEYFPVRSLIDECDVCSAKREFVSLKRNWKVDDVVAMECLVVLMAVGRHFYFQLFKSAFWCLWVESEIKIELFHIKNLRQSLKSIYFVERSKSTF